MARKRLSAQALELACEDPFGPDVLGDDFVVCLECGLLFQALGPHLLRIHDTPVEEYKERYGYNRSQALMSARLIEKFIAQGKAMPDYVIEALSQQGGKNVPRHESITRRPQAMPALIERNRLQAQAVPSGLDSPLYRLDVTVERVAELRAQGMKKRDIAIALQCDPRVVWQRMKEAGLNRPLRRLDVTSDAVAQAYRDGVQSIQGLQARFGCGANLIRQHLFAAGIIPPQSDTQRPARKPRVPTRPDITPDAVATAHRQGMSWTAMCTHFQCTEAVIRQRLHQAGVALKRGAPAHRNDISTEAIVAAREQGMTLKQLCTQFECSEALIRRRLDEAGVPRLSVTLRIDVSTEAVAHAAAQGESVAEMAVRFACSEDLILTRLKQAGQFVGGLLKGTDDATLLDKRRAGMSIETLATELRCTHAAVARRLSEAVAAQAVLGSTEVSLESMAATVRTLERSVPALADHLHCSLPAARGLLRVIDAAFPPPPRTHIDVSRETLQTLLEQGLTRHQIGQQLGLSQATLSHRIDLYGLKRTTPVKPNYQSHITPEQVVALRQDGLSLAAIAETLGCSSLVIQQRLRGAGLDPIDHRRSDVTRERILEAQAQGLSVDQIAKELDCSVSTIFARLRDTRESNPLDIDPI